MINKIIEYKSGFNLNKPLIHCITNHISINDCANALLAIGCRPIMSEHYAEVADITKSSKALAVNLGNINDERIKSMMISGKVAKQNQIPSCIDLVGVACSSFRNDFARKYIKECSPSVIKGNITEIKSLYYNNLTQNGVDVCKSDIVTQDNIKENAKMLVDLSNKVNAVVVATGVIDLIAYDNKCYAICNGNDLLSKITGTGCMLNSLIAGFISGEDILLGSILATVYLGISGEKAFTNEGTGTFKVRLFDALSTMTDKQIIEHIKLSEV